MRTIPILFLSTPIRVGVFVGVLSRVSRSRRKQQTMVFPFGMFYVDAFWDGVVRWFVLRVIWDDDSVCEQCVLRH